MRVLDIVWKDLRQIVTDWRTPVFLVIMPVVFTIFFGVAFAGSGEVDPRVPVAVINRDDGQVSAWIVQAVEMSEVVRSVEVEMTGTDALKAAVLDETVSAAVTIPSGYSDAAIAWAASDSRRQTTGNMGVEIEIWYDPGTQAGHAARNEIQTIIVRGLGAVQVGGIASDVLAEQQPFSGETARMAFIDIATGEALAAWQEPAFTVESRMGGQREEEQGLTNSYAQSSPGMIVQFGVTGIMSAASLVVAERKSKTLQRLLTTSIRRSEIIAAKLLSGFIQIFVQILLLTAFGQLLYDLPYYNHPLALLLLSSAFAFTVSAMGLLIGALARSDEAVVIMVLIPMFLLSALGGAWFPLETMPEGMRLAGRIATPTAWAMEGYQDIIVRGQGLDAIWLPVLVVAAWGLAFFVLAVWRLRFTE